MTTPLGPAARVTALRTALQAVGDALVAPAVAPLTAAEAALAAAVAEFSPRQSDIEALSPADRAALLDEARAARAALDRCRRLGASLSAVVTASLAAQGRGAGYGPRGEAPVQAPAGVLGVRG